MWIEFVLGFVAGALTYRTVKSETKEAQVQADELVITSSQPINIKRD
jgi:hypothetical protein